MQRNWGLGEYVGWMDGLMKSFCVVREEISQSDRDGGVVDFKIDCRPRWRWGARQSFEERDLSTWKMSLLRSMRQDTLIITTYACVPSKSLIYKNRKQIRF